jgi:hypothetical protein
MGFGKLFQVLLFIFAIVVLAVMLVTRAVQYLEGGASSFDDDDTPTSEHAPE